MEDDIVSEEGAVDDPIQDADGLADGLADIADTTVDDMPGDDMPGDDMEGD